MGGLTGRRPLLIAAAASGSAAAVALAVGYAAVQSGAPAATARFTDSGVTVTVKVAKWDGKRGTLAVTFAPDQPGFHLYSVSLPEDGVGGVGRPTRVAVTGRLAPAGPLTADAPVQDIPLTATGLTMPVYPDGPVTTELPIASSGSGAATILLSYAACDSKVGCLMPVKDHAVAVTVSQSSITGSG